MATHYSTWQGHTMSIVKNIHVRTITPQVGNKFVKEHHYSGKVVPNSRLHLGAFYKGILHGVMQFGASINKKGTINLVEKTGWNEFIELNRMAFDDYLPKNSESRCIAIALKIIKKEAPHIKWVISFADATQCGDGTIYRASGFKLVEIRDNTAIRVNPATNEKMHIIQAHHKKLTKEFKKWQPVAGKQLKYVYLIDKTCKLTKPLLDFKEIDENKAGMYLGKKISLAERKVT